MRPTLSLPFFAAALAVALPTLAIAADYDPPIYVDKVPEYKPVEIGSGWYLRGDLGYSLSTKARDAFTYRTFDAGPPASYSSDTFDSVDLSQDLNFGLGFGYHFNDWLRSDVTLERVALDFNGTRTSTTPCGAGGTGCRTEDESSLYGYSAMLNGYVDLGTFVGVTPYVGAGAGYTYVKWDAMRSDAYCTGAGCVTSFQETTEHSGETSWRFTYALMAGFAYDVTRNLKVDIGYKYRRISSGDMFGWSSADSMNGATGVQGHDGGFSQHEVHVGLRYELW